MRLQRDKFLKKTAICKISFLKLKNLMFISNLKLSTIVAYGVEWDNITGVFFCNVAT